MSSVIFGPRFGLVSGDPNLPKIVNDHRSAACSLRRFVRGALPQDPSDAACDPKISRQLHTQWASHAEARFLAAAARGMLLAAYIARRRVMTSSHASLRRPPPSMP